MNGILCRLQTRSAGLLEDKVSCGLSGDARCTLCDSGEQQDVVHFLLGCDEFRMRREM